MVTNAELGGAAIRYNRNLVQSEIGEMMRIRSTDLDMIDKCLVCTVSRFPDKIMEKEKFISKTHHCICFKSIYILLAAQCHHSIYLHNALPQ